MNKKNFLSTVILLTGVMLSVTGKAQRIHDSIINNPLDTIVSYDIFDKLSEPAGGGKVFFGGDDIKSVINEMKTQKSAPLKGWRIRIFRDSNQAASRRAESTKSEIEKNYPGLPVYVTHKPPTFYVEVGDYRRWDDAEKMRRTLISEHGGASVVPVLINFPPL
jgi:hypothetical protein